MEIVAVKIFYANIQIPRHEAEPSLIRSNIMAQVKFAELVRQVSTETGFTQRATREVLVSVIRQIEANLGEGNAVGLPGLGKFKPVHRNARVGHNPRTGESLSIPARNSAIFKLSAGLKASLRGE